MHPPIRRIARIATAVLITAGVTTTAAATTPFAASAAPTPVRATVAATPAHKVGGYVQPSQRYSARTRLPNNLAAAAATVPASVDLRSYAPSPGDQGQIGSCVAWSIAYGIMGYYANRTHGSGAPYAPLYLYMRTVAPGSPPNSGLYPNKALDEAKNSGVDTLADYFQGNYNYSAAPTPAEIANAKNYKVSGYTTLFVGSRQGPAGSLAIKQALAAGNPVAIGIPVFADFFSMPANSLYNTLSGSSYGGHMIAVFGYDEQGVWIRNSWGRSWGTSGDAHLSWAFIEAQASAAYAVAGITTPSAPVATPPAVNALSLKSGYTSGGLLVAVTGSNLHGATAVTFGGTPATFTEDTSDAVSKLIVSVPAHAAGTVDVVVTTPGGTSAASAATKFTYETPPPIARSVSPTTVTSVGGTLVTLTGQNLTGATVVSVGGTRASSVKVVNDTTVTFVSPVKTGAGTFPVTVTTPKGTSPVNGAPLLTEVLPPAPAVTGVSPNRGSTLGRAQVTITGTNFTGATAVTVGGVYTRFTTVSDTRLTVALLPHSAGTADIVVTTPGGRSATSTADTFTWITPPLPAVTGVSPNTGSTIGTAVVTVTGTTIGATSRVTVDGVAQAFTNVSDTQLRVALKPHAPGTSHIVVTGPTGTSLTGSADTYTWVAPPAPVVSAVTPSSGPVKRAAVVTVTVNNLIGLSKVYVNGVAVPYTVTSATTVRVTVPAMPGGSVPIKVATAGGYSTQSASTLYTYGVASGSIARR
jgi:hypothetical protein